LTVEEKAEAVVYTPTWRPRPRKGRGFSFGEIRGAGLTPHDARRLGIPVDRRRRTSRPQNVQRLKEDYGAVVPLTEIKGVGATAEKRLMAVDIMDAYDLARADLTDLSKRVRYSEKTLQGWQREAKKLLKGR